MDGSRAFTGPEQVVVDLTNRCNNNCMACWTGSPLLREKTPPDHWKSQEFPHELMKEIIHSLHRLGTQRIRFTGGGEPFTHAGIMDLLEYVKSLGMICALTTNFTLMDEDKISRIMEIGLDEMAVSLWAGDPATFSRVHPNKTEKTFNRISHLLHRLGSEKNHLPKVTISNVLFNMNYPNAAQMFDFAQEVKADAVYYTLVDPIPGYTDCLLLTPEQSKELLFMVNDIEAKAAGLPKDEQVELENFQQFKRRLANMDAKGGHYDNNIIDTIPCYIGWMFCRLLPDGSVSPCCRGVNKPMGNLFHNSFEEIWASATYGEFRHNAKHLKKGHPYFHPIGCDTTCDNLMHNLDMHGRVLEIYPDKEKELTDLK
jgi:MoaA/NifB/PqqE/SkfB family radical SAM enzyme